MKGRAIMGAAALSLLCGCPDPGTYGTPRTLAPGDFQMQASTVVSGFTARGSTAVTPGLPSLGVRFGVADRLDVGARLVDFFGLGGDVKYNFVRGRIDLAVDPMVQAFYLPSAQYTASTMLSTDIGVFQLHAPLLLGINFDEATTLTLTPGFIATLSTAQPADHSGTTSQIAFASSGLGARMGIGLNVHTSDRFSWQPEVTAWHEFNQVDSWVYMLGIGINIGNQPDFSDLEPR